jgi:cytidine deaminase
MDVSDPKVRELMDRAWRVREHAYVLGPTKVGCAVMTELGDVFVGCNVEHKFRSHDVHAEVNAITSMVSAGQRDLAAVAIAAEREVFTPCGACLDWIFQFGSDKCRVFVQSIPGGPLKIYAAAELMPHYPK